MSNEYVYQKLMGIQSALVGLHQGGAKGSTASRGEDREGFILHFLNAVLPPLYGFGSGDATDKSGRRTGQLDIVVEYPFAPALPPGTGRHKNKLYLAECIAAVIEVKSDVARQWKEVTRTSAKLKNLRRDFGAQMLTGYPPQEVVPLFAVGYEGWSTIKSLRSKLAVNPEIAGILIIKHGLFAFSRSLGAGEATRPWALWALICALHDITNGLRASSPNPWEYYTGVRSWTGTGAR